MEISFTVISIVVAVMLALAAALRWFRHRRCAYHVDTGYWKLVTCSFLFFSLVWATPLVSIQGLLSTYTFHALEFVALALLWVALARLLAWTPHRHATP